MRSTNITLALAIVALLAAVAMIGTWDADAAAEQRAEYCEMVKTWNNQSHLPPEQRDGWPPFNGECND